MSETKNYGLEQKVRTPSIIPNRKGDKGVKVYFPAEASTEDIGFLVNATNKSGKIRPIRQGDRFSIDIIGCKYFDNDGNLVSDYKAEEVVYKEPERFYEVVKLNGETTTKPILSEKEKAQEIKWGHMDKKFGDLVDSKYKIDDLVIAVQCIMYAKIPEPYIPEVPTKSKKTKHETQATIVMRTYEEPVFAFESEDKSPDEPNTTESRQAIPIAEFQEFEQEQLEAERQRKLKSETSRTAVFEDDSDDEDHGEWITESLQKPANQ
ncbi:MAG: hypothetical protein V3V78_03500 [Candidatus Woesearchaeota archaeon]